VRYSVRYATANYSAGGRRRRILCSVAAAEKKIGFGVYTQGHYRWYHGSLGTGFYAHSIVTIWPYHVSFLRESEKLIENREFFSYLLYLTPLLWSPRWNITTTFGTEKLERCGYPMVKKVWRYFIRFDTTMACDNRTDRQTDILRQHSPRYS